MVFSLWDAEGGDSRWSVVVFPVERGVHCEGVYQWESAEPQVGCVYVHVYEWSVYQ